MYLSRACCLIICVNMTNCLITFCQCFQSPLIRKIESDNMLPLIIGLVLAGAALIIIIGLAKHIYVMEQLMQCINILVNNRYRIGVMGDPVNWICHLCGMTE